MAEGPSSGDTTVSALVDEEYSFPKFYRNASFEFSSIQFESDSISDSEQLQQNAKPKDRQLSKTSIDSGTHDHVDNLDQLKIHCKCPCESTNFSHCINPPPQCLVRRYANPLGFPEMDVTIGEDSKEASRAMKQYLSDKTERLKKMFTKYAMAVCYYARDVKGINFPLENIYRLRYPEKEPIAESDMSNFQTIYNAVTQDVDYLNFDMLEDILEACDNFSEEKDAEKKDSAQAKKQSYENAFREFAQLRVFSVIGGLRPLRPPVQEGTYRQLKVKVEKDFEAFTIGRVNEFKEKIREVLHIPKDVFLKLTEVKQGCVEITFEMIGRVDNSIFEISLPKKMALAFHCISMLKYAGKFCYCCCELVANEESDGSIIEKLYSGNHFLLSKNTTQAENKDETASSYEGKHSADCPSNHSDKVKCPTEKCVYCEAKFHVCSIEFHTLVCDKRNEVSSDDDEEVFDDNHSESQDKHDASYTQEVMARTRTFEATATSVTGSSSSFTGPCLIYLDRKSITIRHGHDMEKWPYLAIRTFSAYEQHHQGLFIFESKKEGPNLLTEYNFVLSLETLAELKEFLTNYTDIKLSSVIVTHRTGLEKKPSSSLLFSSNISINTIDSEESGYSSERSSPVPSGSTSLQAPSEIQKCGKNKLWEIIPKPKPGESARVKGHCTLSLPQQDSVNDNPKQLPPMGVSDSQAQPTEEVPVSKKNQLKKKFPLGQSIPNLEDKSKQPAQQHHLYSIDEKGETLLNVSPTIKRRRSAGDKHTGQQHHLYSFDEKGETLLNVSPTIKRRRSAGDKHTQDNGKLERSNKKTARKLHMHLSSVSI